MGSCILFVPANPFLPDASSVDFIMRLHANQIRLIAGISGLLLAFLGGWKMSSQLLWGYWSLPLLLGSWLLILALVAPRIWKVGASNRSFHLASLTGVLLWLGFPDMPFAPLLFLAFVPLILIEEELAGQPHAGRRLAFYAFHAFFLWNVLSTFWVTNTAFFAGIFANVVNAALMVIPILGYHFLRRAIGDRFRWASLISFWMMFEWTHLHWDLTWPFLSLGNAMAEWPSVIQWYSYTGGFGGTLWILAGNILLYPLVKEYLETRSIPTGRQWVPLAVWVLIPLGISLVMFGSWQPKGEEIEVAVVQPNFEPHYEKFEVPQEIQHQRFQTLARSVLTPQTRYLVFPETSYGNFDLDRIDNQPFIRDLQGLMDSFPKCALVLGLDPYRFLPQGEESPARRPYIRPGQDTLWWEAYNLAAQLSAEEETQIYIKGKLVPGAEIFPFRRILFFLEPLVDQLGGSLEGLRRSERRSVFLHDDMRMGTAICYESVFGEYCGGYVQQGAQVLAIITNDGWWDLTPGHRQHLRFGALRAIETRRDIIRSANTGISCLIDQRGQVHQPQAYGVAAAFRGTVRLNDQITFYTRWGDILARIAGFLSIVFVTYGVVTAVKKRIIAS